MRKYSKVTTYNFGDMKMKYRYNFADNVLELVTEPSEEMIQDIEDEALNSRLDWMREDAKRNLISYEDTGLIVITSEPLGKDSWKSDPDYYMDMMSENISCLLGA